MYSDELRITLETMINNQNSLISLLKQSDINNITMQEKSRMPHTVFYKLTKESLLHACKMIPNKIASTHTQLYLEDQEHTHWIYLHQELTAIALIDHLNGCLYDSSGQHEFIVDVEENGEILPNTYESVQEKYNNCASHFISNMDHDVKAVRIFIVYKNDKTPLEIKEKLEEKYKKQIILQDSTPLSIIGRFRADVDRLLMHMFGMKDCSNKSIYEALLEAKRENLKLISELKKLKNPQIQTYQKRILNFG